ncbi:hypothetical protein KHP62_01270 [Rhodobacteraceae bacterium NNCM2]|nr:hypothetical protein [Coraliihabitans acroporae]
MRNLVWLIRRLAGVVVVLAVVGVIALVSVYLGGVRVPIVADVAPLSYENWNRTNRLSAEVDYRSSFVRQGDRVLVTVDLALPDTVERVREFLDGGRSEVVACGEQKLYFHKLEQARIEVDKPTIWIGGNADMELDGVISARDDWPVAVNIQTGHDRHTLWADMVGLRIADVPQPMVKTLLDAMPRLSYTREQVLDLASASLPDDLAQLLKVNRDALDLEFEDITPSKEGNSVTLDATFSVNEQAAFNILRDKVLASAGHALTVLASLAAPRPANAQFFDKLKELSDSLDLEGGAGEVLKGLQEGKSPEEILQNALAGLSNCKATF